MVGALSTVIDGSDKDSFFIIDYRLLFDSFLYFDILIGIWSLWSVFSTGWIRHCSLLLIPGFILLFSLSDTYGIVFLLFGFITDFLLYRLFPYLHSCFSISEMILIIKFLFLFLFLLSFPSMQVASVVIIESSIFTAFVLFLHSSFYTIPLIIAGAAIEIASLSWVLKEPFIPWFISWFFELNNHSNDASFSIHRLLILCYWFGLLALSITFVCKGYLKNLELIIQRKFFHILSVALFLPIALYDSYLMKYSKND